MHAQNKLERYKQGTGSPCSEAGTIQMGYRLTRFSSIGLVRSRVQSRKPGTDRQKRENTLIIINFPSNVGITYHANGLGKKNALHVSYSHCIFNQLTYLTQNRHINRTHTNGYSPDHTVMFTNTKQAYQSKNRWVREILAKLMY